MKESIRCLARVEMQRDLLRVERELGQRFRGKLEDNVFRQSSRKDGRRLRRSEGAMRLRARSTTYRQSEARALAQADGRSGVEPPVLVCSGDNVELKAGKRGEQESQTLALSLHRMGHAAAGVDELPDWPARAVHEHVLVKEATECSGRGDLKVLGAMGERKRRG